VRRTLYINGLKAKRETLSRQGKIKDAKGKIKEKERDAPLLSDFAF
jgi:hypothetical protein